MRKYLFFILSITIFFSCSKEVDIKTEEISKQENQQTDENALADNEDEQPVIKINTNDELIITVRFDYEPFMWVEDTKFKGFYVDIEKTILERMNQNYIFVEFTNAEETTMDIKEGRVHAGLGGPVSEDYMQMWNYANSYITLDLITLVENNTTDIGGNTPEEVIQSLFGKTVGVQARGIEYNLLREYKEINIIEYETGTVALEMLAIGKVDAKVENLEIALHYARKNDWNIKPVGVPLHSMVVATVFSKKVDPEIIERYNAALKEIQDNGTYDRIYNSWFGE